MKMVRAGEIELGVDDAGSGTPVVFVHGTLPDHHVFDTVIAMLRGKGRMISYDRRGFSGSVGAIGTSFSEHANDLANLLQALAVPTAIVVGWSWGGLVALQLASQRPDLVTSLVLVEPAVHIKKHPTFKVLRAIVGAQLLAIVGRKKDGAERFFRWALARSGMANSFDTLATEHRNCVTHNAAAILAEIALGTGEALEAEAISRILSPTVIVTGGLSDPAFKASSSRIANLLKQAKSIEIEQSGHAVPFDQPQLLAGVIAQQMQ